MNSSDAAVGDVELAVEVERARVRVRAVLGDLAVVDVAGELGRVLVLLVLGLEGADADAVLLAEDQAPSRGCGSTPSSPSRPRTSCIRALKMKRLAGSRSPSTRTLYLSFERPSCAIALARHSGGMRRSGSSFIGLGKRSTSWFCDPGPARFDPLERVERAVGRARVLLDALLEEARDRALRRADRPVQEDDALLRAVALGRRLEHVHEPHQRDVEAEDRVGAARSARP